MYSFIDFIVLLLRIRVRVVRLFDLNTNAYRHKCRNLHFLQQKQTLVYYTWYRCTSLQPYTVHINHFIFYFENVETNNDKMRSIILPPDFWFYFFFSFLIFHLLDFVDLLLVFYSYVFFTFFSFHQFMHFSYFSEKREKR